MVPGYSKVRWWSKAEIWFVMAENFNQLPVFLRRLLQHAIGEATTIKLNSVFNAKKDALEIELATIMEARRIVSTTYELEGDRLEMLVVYDRIEELRAWGRALLSNHEGILPNVDLVLRRRCKLVTGLKIAKSFPGHGMCDAKIISEELVESTLYPGKEVTAYTVRYEVDGATEDLEEEEIRRLIKVRELPERKLAASRLSKAMEYLEQRLMPEVGEEIYDLSGCYEMCRLVRFFDPEFASKFADPACVDSLAAGIQPIAELINLDKLKAELPLYLAAAKDAEFDTTDIAGYTDSILAWWRKHGSRIPTWAGAARIIFAFSPNSASCERVFSLLENMFGETQGRALSDLIEASLMLAYNKRSIG